MKKLTPKPSILTHKKSEIIAILDSTIANGKPIEPIDEVIANGQVVKGGIFLVSKQIYSDCQFYKMTEYKGIKIQPFY